MRIGMTSFSEIIDTISPNGDAHVPQDWQQGRTTYGGLSAALCVAGALRMLPDLPPLRSAQFTFIGPAAGALRIAPSILRKGKNSVFVGVDLHAESGLATRAILSFAAARASSLHYRAHRAPSVPPPEACAGFFAGGTPPRFAAQFDMRRAGSHAPLSSAAEPDLLIWFRHRDPAARHGLVALIALADALPPAAFSMFAAPAPISTITWSIDILDADAAYGDTGEGWHLMQSLGDHIADGYTSQGMTVWNEDFLPVLAARQMVAIFV